MAAERISGALPDTKIVMLSESEHDDLFDALQAGAIGYLLTTTSVARLPHAIRGVVDGQAALPREFTAHLIREFRERGARRRRVRLSGSAGSVELTAREFRGVAASEAGRADLRDCKPSPAYPR